MSARFSTLCLVLAICLHIGLAQECECPTPDDGYELFPSYNASRYKLSLFQLFWEDAIIQCQGDGGGSHLVVMNSEEEAEVVSTLVARAVNSYVWVGINDIDVEDTWRTALGGLVSESGYDKWGSDGLPSGTDEDCGFVKVDALYYDSLCNIKRYFICEKPYL